jgi:hypothetical protein
MGANFIIITDVAFHCGMGTCVRFPQRSIRNFQIYFDHGSLKNIYLHTQTD